MHRKQRKLPWTLTWLVLGLAVSAWAQVAGGGEEAQLQPAEYLQVTQNSTIAVCGHLCECVAAITLAVCGNTCNCAPAVLLTKVSGGCTVTSSFGQCSASSGECCVC